jgi:hypothetical protein
MTLDRLFVLIVALAVVVAIVWAEVVTRRRHASGEWKAGERSPDEPHPAREPAAKDKRR